LAQDYYEVLQVHTKAEAEVIQAAYRRLSMKYHPDVYKGSDANVRMRELNQAYEVLSVPEKRNAYDRAMSRTDRAPVSSAKIQISPTVVDLGEIEVTRTRTSVVRISNLGTGLLSGLVVSHVPWVNVSPTEFKSNELDLVVRAQPTKPGFYWYPKGLEIFSNGGRTAIGVKVNVAKYRGNRESELVVRKDTPLQMSAQQPAMAVERYYRFSKFWVFVLLLSLLASSAVWYLISPWLVALPAFVGGGFTAWRLIGAGILPDKIVLRQDKPDMVQMLCSFCNARLQSNSNRRCGKCKGLICHVCKGCQCKVSFNKL